MWNKRLKHVWEIGKDVPEEGEAAEEGCVGCGWYDVAKWKEELNKKLQKQKKKKPTKKP